VEIRDHDRVDDCVGGDVANDAAGTLVHARAKPLNVYSIDLMTSESVSDDV